jgi:hypothetical protein
MKRISLAAALLALGAAACGAKRTTAATQPSPAAFDASQSDPKALAAVDAALTALGGYDKWTAIKELHFELKVNSGGHMISWQKHTWDRWNGRHHFMMADPSALAVDPSKAGWVDVRYDLFDQSKIPFATFNGGQLGDDDAHKNAINARTLLNTAYPVMIVYKLRDPGVKLTSDVDVNVVPGADDLCKPSCNTVKISFDPSVGSDTWTLELNSASHLPEVILQQTAKGQAALRVDGWIDAAGLKWPAKLSGVGAPSEFIAIENVSAGDVHESEYEVPVDRTGGASTGMGAAPSSAPPPSGGGGM